MLGIGFIRFIWKEMWCDFNLFGKVLFAPIFGAISSFMMVFSLVELVTIDWFMVLLFACDNMLSVKEGIHAMLFW